MTVPPELTQLAHRLIDHCRTNGQKVTVAESCTGGMVCAAITSVAGSSHVFHEGLVAYSNEAKVRALGVATELLEAKGAVNIEVAAAMAEGSLARTQADVAVAITGIAGPDGGTEDKPVGQVCIATARESQAVMAQEFHFHGSRNEIRVQAAARALQLCLTAARA